MPPPPDEATLKPWLTATLAPISDAEPDVLADYVVALLRHGDDRASTLAALQEHLTEFLGENTPAFATRVADALEHPDQLPPPDAPAPAPTLASASASAPAPSSTRSPPQQPQQPHAIPSLDSEERLSAAPSGAGAGAGMGKRKRSISPAMPDAAKAGRLGPAYAPRRSDRERRRDVPEANPLFATGRLELPPAAAAALNSPDDTQATPPDGGKLPSSVCRDFHLRGVCGRGATCKFSHAPLALPTLLAIYRRQVMRETRGPTFAPAPVPGSAGPGPASGPGPGPGPGFGSHLHDPYPVSPARGGGGGYDPAAPPYAYHRPLDEGFPPLYAHPHALGYGAYSPGPSGPAGVGGLGRYGRPTAHEYGHGHGHGHGHGYGNGQAPGPGPGPGQGPGQRQGQGQGNGAGRSATSLVVQGIPAASASEEVVHAHFAQFGPLADVTVDPLARKAIVTYVSAEHARHAKHDPSVLFGDRFVKVFFQRDRPERPGAAERPGAMGERATESAQMHMHGRAHAYGPDGHMNGGARAPPQPRPPLLTPSDVKMLMTDARAKQAAVEAQLDEQKRLMQQLTTPGAVDDRAAVMARLRTLAQEIAQNTARAKEAAEKAAKAQAGKVTALPEPPRPRTFRPPFRAGGGHLDLRPTTMCVSLPPGMSVESETEAQVVKHFETFGSLVSVKHTPDEHGTSWSIQWANRHEGDKAVWSGGHVPGVGQVHMRWAPAPNASATFSFAGASAAAPAPAPAPASVSASASGAGAAGSELEPEPEPEPEPDTGNADDLYAV